MVKSSDAFQKLKKQINICLKFKKVKNYASWSQKAHKPVENL